MDSQLSSLHPIFFSFPCCDSQLQIVNDPQIFCLYLPCSPYGSINFNPNCLSGTSFARLTSNQMVSFNEVTVAFSKRQRAGIDIKWLTNLQMGSVISWWRRTHTGSDGGEINHDSARHHVTFFSYLETFGITIHIVFVF